MKSDECLAFGHIHHMLPIDQTDCAWRERQLVNGGEVNRTTAGMLTSASCSELRQFRFQI